MTTWSVHFIGRPDAIARALIAYGNSLTGPERASFNQVRPVLERLVELNTGADAVLSLNASGTANGTTSGVSVVLMQSNAMHVQ